MKDWNVVGVRVRWVEPKDGPSWREPPAGVETVKRSGRVVACGRAGAGWTLLVLTTDGALHSMPYSRVTVDFQDDGSPYRG